MRDSLAREMASCFVKKLVARVGSAGCLPTASASKSRFSQSGALSSPAGSELNIRLNPTTEHYDPARTFLKKDVQRILYRITGLDSHRLTVKKNMTDILELPVHRFLTEEEYEIEQTRGLLLAKKRLKMPPVMAPRKPGGEVIAADSQLDKLLEHKIIFTDVAYGLKDRERAVVVRETDGTLRDATWDEKMRMCQTFVPRVGRECFPPRMFRPEYLTRALDHVSATYLLNGACAQFEPDDPDYVRVVHAVYDNLDEKGTYDELYSTRFFGGLVFYLAGVARLDGFISDRLKRGMMADAADVVRLLNILHPKCKCAVEAMARTTADDDDSRPSDRLTLEMYVETMARGGAAEKLRLALAECSETNERDGVAVSQ